MKKLSLPRSAWIMITVMLTTGIAITVSAMIFKPNFLEIVPLYISLIIGFLQSRVNRFGSLIGGFNSILYGIVYFSFGLYGNCLYAILVSAPLQIITFIMWNKNAFKETTYFKVLTNKQRIAIIGGFLVCWIILYIVLQSVGSEHSLLDNTITLFGILTTVLMMFAFVEYTVLMVVSNIVSLVLYITMIAANPERITFLIYTVYSTVCCVIALFGARRHYIAQQNIKYG